jgi:preprotein translocase subunit SecD
MNRYPLWKNLLLLGVILAALLLALPNIYGDDPALQITRSDGQPLGAEALETVKSTLDEKKLSYLSAAEQGNGALVRFATVAAQLQAGDLLRDAMPNDIVAITLAPRTPHWLQVIGLKPMSLGLDLRGGVHFLYQVELSTAINQYLETYVGDMRTQFREAGIRNQARVEGDQILVELIDGADAPRAESIIRTLDAQLQVQPTTLGGQAGFRVRLSPQLLRQRQDFAIQQNITTLRNRVNELGVSEPIVQRQGLDRILVQLPGVQDPAQAERVLGATATLEFHLVDTENDAFEADRRGRPPVGTILRKDKSGRPVLLRREVIVSGDQLTDATFGYVQGQPAVFVRLNAQGARRMLETTQANLNRPMAVLFIEEKPKFVERDGEQRLETSRDETVINEATIRGVFSSRFQITGVSPFEGQDLALLLRAGALAAPIVKVEERTIGPSLGQDNINKGREAVIVGFVLVVLFMAFYYRVFGLIADLALFANLVLMVAVLSLLQASLTLPGIAGIVLTVGMAVDANVLIFERIREELRNGNSPQASIRAGYEKAFSTIADANITTLIAALVLFFFGTGPIKGFAVTLAIGIITSMFTAIVGTRAVVNFLYGGRDVKHLAIGGTTSHATA